MTINSTKQVALDDAFIRIFIEELSGDTASLSQADQSPGREAEDTQAEDTKARTHLAVSQPQVVQPQTVEPQVVEQVQPALAEKPTTTQPSPVAAPSQWQLRVVQPGRKECILPLGEKPISIGRSSQNSLVLICDQISREHARIWLDKTGPRVEDLNSNNGTWVNGTKVPAAYLRAKDIICIGKVSIHVEQA